MISEVKVKSVDSYVEKEARGKKISHCLASTAIVNSKGQDIALLVVDRYTPKGARAGWYFAFRRPGQTERQTPVLRIFAASNMIEFLHNFPGDFETLLSNVWEVYGLMYHNLIMDNETKTIG